MLIILPLRMQVPKFKDTNIKEHDPMRSWCNGSVWRTVRGNSLIPNVDTAV